jgi:osmotically-inducible protein OsmY
MNNAHAFAVKHALVAVLSIFVSFMAIRAESGADASITMQAQATLRAAFGTRVSAVAVDTRHGYVTLHGKVTREGVKTKSAKEVWRVRGVLGVRNLLQVVPNRDRVQMQRSDDVVTADIRRMLREDAGLDDSSITVRSVSNGVVLLSGDAASLDDDVRALRATAARPGVRQVFSEIEAAGAPRADLGLSLVADR